MQIYSARPEVWERVQCMATSDNVVRAGLTPKWKDVDTLCDMLTYADGAPHFVAPTQPDNEPHVWRYTPPEEVDAEHGGVNDALGDLRGCLEELDDELQGVRDTLAVGAYGMNNFAGAAHTYKIDASGMGKLVTEAAHGGRCPRAVPGREEGQRRREEALGGP